MRRGICLLAPGGAGGIQTCTHLLAQELARRGRKVRIVETRGARAWTSPLHTLRAGLLLARLALTGEARVAHLMASERMSLLRKGLLLFWARALGLQVLLHHHGAEFVPWSHSRGPLGRFWLRRIARGADLHLVLGRDWARRLAELGADPARVLRLPNGLPERPPPERRRPSGAPLRVLFLAVMTRRKGADLLVEALARLNERGVAVEAVFAGDGPEREAARRAARKARLAARFPGLTDAGESARLMEWADVLAHPSDREGLPMTLLEAMRAGLPAVAVPAGAIGEWLSDGRGLRHVRPRDPASLANALERLASDPAGRAALGAAGRAAFERSFRIERLADRLEAIYDQPPVGAQLERPDAPALP